MDARLTRAGGNCFLVVSRTVVGRDEFCAEGQIEVNKRGRAGVGGAEFSTSLYSSSWVGSCKKGKPCNFLGWISEWDEEGRGFWKDTLEKQAEGQVGR